MSSLWKLYFLFISVDFLGKNTKHTGILKTYQRFLMSYIGMWQCQICRPVEGSSIPTVMGQI